MLIKLSMMKYIDIHKTSLYPLFQSNNISDVRWFCVHWLAWSFVFCSPFFFFFFEAFIYHFGSNVIQNDWLLHFRLSPFAFTITNLTWFSLSSIYSCSFGISFITFIMHATFFEIRSLFSHSEKIQPKKAM